MTDGGEAGLLFSGGLSSSMGGASLIQKTYSLKIK